MSNESQQVVNASFSQMLEKAKAYRAAPPRSRQASGNDELAAGIVPKEVSSIQLPAIPPTPAKPDHPEILKMMGSLRVHKLVLTIGAIDRDKLDKRKVTKAGRKTASFSTNEMFFSNFGKDGEFFNVAKSVPVGLYDDDKYREFMHDLKTACDYIGSSGSMTGLLTRLTIGMTEAPRVSLDVKECARWANSVLGYHDVETDFVGKSVADVLNDETLGLKFNENASAGVPYYCKISDGDTFMEALDVATLILNSISDGKFQVLVGEQRPSLMAVMLKNKQDYYKIDRLRDKIRPYFVYPFHERLLYSALQANLKAVRFDEDAELCSGSAVGFSWNYGGGDRLYGWIMRVVRNGLGMYSLFYGDDQLWVFVLVTGQVLICTPDFSHMDLSLSSDWAQVCYRVWEPYFLKLDKTWREVLKLNCKRAFIKQVIVEGPLAFQFKHGLGSGIPGTTKFDEVASAAVNGYIQSEFKLRKNDIQSPADLGKFLFEMGEETKKRFGLIFKEGSFNPTIFTPGEPEYHFEFLGQTLVRVAGKADFHYVPKPKQSRLLLAATTYKKSYKSAMIRQRASMSKFRSLYAGGGYLHPIFEARIRAQYNSMLQRRIRPLGEDDVEYVSEADHNVFVNIEFDKEDPTMPTSAWCMNLYLPPDDQLEDYIHEDVEERMTSVPSEAGVRDVPDFGLDDFESDSDSDKEKLMQQKFTEAVNPSDWGRQAELERSSAPEVGSSALKPPVEVAPSTMQGLQPLSAAAKKKFEDEQALARQKIKESREIKVAQRAASKAPKKGSKRSARRTRTGGDLTAEDFEGLDISEPEED